ncbi:Essential recombination function protein [uncultured Caudovirales phage]|uniref:Essential recombination function protein n=1 Tax=uncultured Caudovirales phage TaxID=2100421 RepID=A0A6J5N5S2_9CAUD|nr:Essential recombination function protein [uncultured Caudovirales phage]
MTQQNIYQAVNAIMQEIEAIGKNKTNSMQGYKFRGIDDMYNALQPLFKKHSVFITSNVLESKREERQTAKGGVLIYTIAKCQFKFFTTDGSFIESVLEGEAMDSGDKSTNKAMSTALKYALMQMFLIPTEEKLDTEYDTHEIAPKQKPAPKATPELSEIDVLTRKAYATADDVLMVLDSCETIGQLNSLYHMNSKIVEENNIKSHFTTKKDAIRKAS